MENLIYRYFTETNCITQTRIRQNRRPIRL